MIENILRMTKRVLSFILIEEASRPVQGYEKER